MVEDAVVADAVAGARLGQQVGRVGHRLHAAGQDDVGRAGQDQVVGQHGGLHARAADLVDGGGAGGVGQAGAARGLAGGRLALAGGQDAAHQHLVDALRRQAGAVERGADRVRAQSAGRPTPASSPWKRPSGVRAAETMTTGSRLGTRDTPLGCAGHR